MADPKTLRASFDPKERVARVYGERDTEGKQHVVRTIEIDPSSWPADMLHSAAVIGATYVAQNGYNRLDDPTPEKVAEVIEATLNSFADGSWHPGRTFAASEPDDIVVALAEATGVPVHVMQQDIEDRLVRDENGEPVKDKRGRNKRVFTQAVLAKLADDPALRPIMARLAAERAKRLAEEARKGSKQPTTGALDMFAHLRQGVPAADTDKEAAE